MYVRRQIRVDAHLVVRQLIASKGSAKINLDQGAHVSDQSVIKPLWCAPWAV
jgi:hypothetical protein